MSSYMYRIAGTLEFPDGLMAGEGEQSNMLTVARNGAGEPVLRGTALAGALRSRFPEDLARTWFGTAVDTDEGQESRVCVADSVLNLGNSQVAWQTYHMRNRHTGVVVEGGLFSLEQLPPGTTAPLLLYVNTQDVEQPQCDQFLDALVSALGTALTLGGNRNRGLGRAMCKNNVLTLHRFDLYETGDYADWLDVRYADRRNRPVTGGEERHIVADPKSLVVKLTVGIPRGEDILIASGGNDMMPQETVSANGQTYWSIPGSSLRGLFRSWITRLAVRDGETVRDSHEIWDEQFDRDDVEEYKPDLIGWGGVKDARTREKYARNPEDLQDPILSLFGSMYKRGRIHITNALSNRPQIRDSDVQKRAHVAIDRFSGGANEGAFFENCVLTCSDMSFSTEISIESPTEQEVQWLVQTLRALHLGILSVGSSKSVGRLEIRSVEANGHLAHMVDELTTELTDGTL